MIPSLILLSLPLASASPAFDPSSAEARFTGDETWSLSGATHLWSAIERLSDPDKKLFVQEEFNSVTAWPEGSTFAPYIAECFGSTTPHSGLALLHRGLNEATASGTPVLFVPGAGDNASRGFFTMAATMDAVGRPVFALTFAHPHGDVFQQAEWVADAIARIKVLTGAAQVDLVSHSKGGLAAAVYLSNSADADWGAPAYASEGTVYRGDVRRAVFIATPLDGIDTNYRWSDLNLSALDADTALSPASWSRYYPYTTAAPYLYEDLAEQDFFAEDGDLFPGQRQLLKRQDYPLPGSLPWLGAYALQWDWYTTYEGGLGYTSDSEGIDAAIEAGGDLIAAVQAQGVDPDVHLFLLAGESPLMPNGSEDLLAQMFGENWVDMATAGVDAWAALIAALVGDGLVPVGISEEEVAGLAAGKVILGEVTGPADGLVFVSSAGCEDCLTARGAPVIEVKVANLSHLDLLYASPTVAAAMEAAAKADPLNDGWMAGFAARYREADTVGWLLDVLADPAEDGDSGEVDDPGDTGDSGEAGDSGDDTALPGDSGSDSGDALNDAPKEAGCASGCSAGGRGPVALPALLAALALARSRARSR